MDGIIIVNKPAGKTSHDVVSFMRRVTGIKKIGHTGTLDPLATGVLPVCIGTATKASDMLVSADKEYHASLILGKATDTLDITGNVISESAVDVCEAEIRKAIAGFEGHITQIPPMYSAIKVNGKKLYELARKGIETERAGREVDIYKTEITDINMKEKSVSFNVVCSKGTYIRTLCDDIGKKLGCGACMSALVRTRTGNFTIENSFTENEIKAMSDEGRLSEALIPTDAFFDGYEKIILNDRQTRSIVNGVNMTWRSAQENKMYRLYDSGQNFLCVSVCENGRLKLIKSFWKR